MGAPCRPHIFLCRSCERPRPRRPLNWLCRQQPLTIPPSSWPLGPSQANLHTQGVIAATCWGLGAALQNMSTASQNQKDGAQDAFFPDSSPESVIPQIHKVKVKPRNHSIPGAGSANAWPALSLNTYMCKPGPDELQTPRPAASPNTCMYKTDPSSLSKVALVCSQVTSCRPEWRRELGLPSLAPTRLWARTRRMKPDPRKPTVQGGARQLRQTQEGLQLPTPPVGVHPQGRLWDPSPLPC